VHEKQRTGHESNQPIACNFAKYLLILKILSLANITKSL